MCGWTEHIIKKYQLSFWIQKQIFVTTVKAAGSNNNSLDLDMIKVIVDRAFLNTETLAGGK